MIRKEHILSILRLVMVLALFQTALPTVAQPWKELITVAGKKGPFLPYGKLTKFTISAQLERKSSFSLGYAISRSAMALPPSSIAVQLGGKERPFFLGESSTNQQEWIKYCRKWLFRQFNWDRPAQSDYKKNAKELFLCEQLLFNKYSTNTNPTQKSSIDEKRLSSSECDQEWIKDRRERVLRLLNWEEDIDKELESPEYNVPVHLDYIIEHDKNTSLIIVFYEYKNIAA